MSNRSFSWDSFWEFPAVGILRGFETDLVGEIGHTCFEAGLKNLEVTLNTDDALNQIRLLRKWAPDGVNVGAGTVLTPEDLHEALEAGAGFIVSPITDEVFIRECAALKIPVFPGAFTPSEVFHAWKAGASVVKLFPANNGGPSYLKSIRAPLNDIPLMAVGSVNLDNLGAYLEAGACSVGLGSPLFEAQRMLAKDWDWLTGQIHAFHQGFNRAKRIAG